MQILELSVLRINNYNLLEIHERETTNEMFRSEKRCSTVIIKLDN